MEIEDLSNVETKNIIFIELKIYPNVETKYIFVELKIYLTLIATS